MKSCSVWAMSAGSPSGKQVAPVAFRRISSGESPVRSHLSIQEFSRSHAATVTVPLIINSKLKSLRFPVKLVDLPDIISNRLRVWIERILGPMLNEQCPGRNQAIEFPISQAKAIVEQVHITRTIDPSRPVVIRDCRKPARGNGAGDARVCDDRPESASRTT